MPQATSKHIFISYSQEDCVIAQRSAARAKKAEAITQLLGFPGPCVCE